MTNIEVFKSFLKDRLIKDDYENTKEFLGMDISYDDYIEYTSLVLNEMTSVERLFYIASKIDIIPAKISKSAGIIPSTNYTLFKFGKKAMAKTLMIARDYFDVDFDDKDIERFVDLCYLSPISE